MEDTLLSQKQIQALISRLDGINEDLTSLKLKVGIESGFISNHDLITLLGVTNRTTQRWRKSGRLPYIKLGKKIYYRADIVLNSFKQRPNCPIETGHPPNEDLQTPVINAQNGCERCPLFEILNT